MISLCSFVEEKFRDCSERDGIGLATSVPTRTLQLSAKEKARRKTCDVTFSFARRNRLQKNYMRIAARKLLRIGLVLARVWGRQAVDISPMERLKLRRQMAAAAGKKKTVSSSLFMNIYDLKVEEDLSTMAALFLGGRCVDDQMGKRAAEGVEEADRCSADLETGERTGRSRRERVQRSWHKVAAVGHYAV